MLTRLMASLLLEVSATDPPTFVMVGVGLTVVGLLACFFRHAEQRRSIRWSH